MKEWKSMVSAAVARWEQRRWRAEMRPKVSLKLYRRIREKPGIDVWMCRLKREQRRVMVRVRGNCMWQWQEGEDGGRRWGGRRCVECGDSQWGIAHFLTCSALCPEQELLQ